jgi:ribosomal protein S18 acetylase RimI-like enzyme
VNQLNERANAFYEKSGFTVIAEKKYRVGNVVDDDYLRVQVLRESDLT